MLQNMVTQKIICICIQFYFSFLSLDLSYFTQSLSLFLSITLKFKLYPEHLLHTQMSPSIFSDYIGLLASLSHLRAYLFITQSIIKSHTIGPATSTWIWDRQQELSFAMQGQELHTSITTQVACGPNRSHSFASLSIARKLSY